MVWSMYAYHKDEGKLIICNFVNGTNTIPLYLLLLKTVESVIFSDVKAGVCISCVNRLEEGSSLQQSEGNY